MTSPEPTCEMDPLTWDALITALKDNGVGDDILDKVCAKPSRRSTPPPSPNATPATSYSATPDLRQRRPTRPTACERPGPGSL